MKNPCRRAGRIRCWRVIRNFICFSLVLALNLDRLQAGESAKPPFQISPAQATRLRQALKAKDAQFDPQADMLAVPFSSPGYHTTLTNGTVHRTRESLEYAVALLDTGDESLRPRAERILRRVISLQDQDPASKTYGIWPWFLEEPLAQMSPPDWNWADFCGVQLLQVALDHRDRLSPDVRALVDRAIQHAARSIQRRNVGPGYTNIAIMGAYVTLVAAELYQLDDLRAYALARWRNFFEFTQRNGGFSEYNSPTYTVVALKELGRLRQHARDPKARRLTEEIYQRAWAEIAQHFHPPTRQWAGPHSRCYRTLLGGSTLALIERATEGRVKLGRSDPELDECRLALPCPPNLEARFTTLAAPREWQQNFIPGEFPVIGTTRLEPAFALGSVNRGDFWNQRRALVAYWGTAAAPSYLHLRFLHDGYDFTAAQFFSAQRGGQVLAAINFATDGGDRHPSLDKIKQGKIRAKDLRLRFEFGGAAGKVKPVAPATLAEPAQLQFGELRVKLAVPFAAFDGLPVHWEAGKDATTAWLDAVIYQGESRAFDLAGMKQAALGVAVSLSTGEGPKVQPAATANGTVLQLDWDGLALAIPIQPSPSATLRKQAKLGELPVQQ